MCMQAHPYESRRVALLFTSIHRLGIDRAFRAFWLHWLRSSLLSVRYSSCARPPQYTPTRADGGEDGGQSLYTHVQKDRQTDMMCMLHLHLHLHLHVTCTCRVHVHVHVHDMCSTCHVHAACMCMWTDMCLNVARC